MTTPTIPPFELGPLPDGRRMITTDVAVVTAPPLVVYGVVREVAEWPRHLPHYRYVRFRASDGAGGGLVEMSANRPFGPLDWPTWWLSEMRLLDQAPAIRFRHVGGITRRMHVEWSFAPHEAGTLVRLLHVWDGPRWPLIGGVAATAVIGPVFIHGIASRTLAGLARVAEQRAAKRSHA